MSEMVLMDNDIVLKACCYDIINELRDCLGGTKRTLNILGSARYVIENAIIKGKNVANKAQASKCLKEFLTSTVEVEPSQDELDLAAQFEEVALTASDLALHGGESQLLAILINRTCLLLVTGDKRAIRAIEPVLAACDRSHAIANCVVCLEQLMATFVERHGAEALHSRVCGEALIDKTMAICFKCVSGSYTSESVLESLASYIQDLRRDVPTILITANSVSAMITQEDGVG